MPCTKAKRNTADCITNGFKIDDTSLSPSSYEMKVRKLFAPSNQILGPYIFIFCKRIYFHEIFAESRKQLLVSESGNVSQYDIKLKTRGIYDTLRAIQSCLIEILAIVCVLLYMHILSQTQRLFFANLISKQTQPGSVFCLYETLP